MYTPPDPLLDAKFWSTATLAEVEAELARGIDPNVTESEGRVPNTITPLHLAAGYGKPRGIAALLDSGAAIEAREDFEDRTPLHMAAYSNPDVGAIALLLERGADIGARDKYGRTALHAAAGEGQQAVVELLLDMGAPIGVTDSWGHTPLHKTAWNQSPGTATLLIDRGLTGMRRIRTATRPIR